MTHPTRADRRSRKSGRHYVVGENEYPSATTVLGVINKPALIPWAANLERTHVVAQAAALYASLSPPLLDATAFSTRLTDSLGMRAHQRRLTAAGAIGTQAHDLIEQRVRAQMTGVTPPGVDGCDPAAIRCADAFRDWQQQMGLVPELIEQVVYSKTHQYAGTLDLVARLDDHHGVSRRVLIDFKTGERVYPEAFLQAALYMVALGEMGHGNVDAAYIVRLPKKGGAVEPVAVPDLPSLWPACEAALTLWHWREAQTR